MKNQCPFLLLRSVGTGIGLSLTVYQDPCAHVEGFRSPVWKTA